MDLCLIKLSLEDKEFSKLFSKIIDAYPYRSFDISIKEQMRYRMYICNQCYVNDKCEKCGCNPEDTFVELSSCNKGMYFPNFMNKWKWEDFKKKNKITFI